MKLPVSLSTLFSAISPRRHVSPSPKKRTSETQLLSYLYKIVDSKRSVRSHSTCSNYLTALRSFSLFLGGVDIPLSHFSPETVSRYSMWLHQKGVSPNTASCYFRSLRSLYNIAVKRRAVRQCHPFGEVFTGNMPTAKRAASSSDIRSLRRLAPPKDTALRLSLDMFLFSFYAMGMPFVDVARLKRSQIDLASSTLTYYRQKTGSCVTISLEPCMLDIIRHYSDSSRQYVFPLLPEQSTAAGLARSYNTALASHNRHLKTIATMAGIPCRLTSYVARHSWASMAYKANAPLQLISQAMGHTNQRTTMVYIKSLDIGAIAKINKRILRETASS
ncbi:MAG: tyrosine-type recombinase/integrase [Prevotella sp.]